MTQPPIEPTSVGDSSHWTRRALLVGLAYIAIGIVFAALAGAAAGVYGIAWRLAAWLISAAIFSSHVRYEYARLDNPPATAAWRAAVAVAFGAFAVAVVAYVRSQMAASPHRPHLLLAFLSWPILTGTVAFVVAFFAASIGEMAAKRFQ